MVNNFDAAFKKKMNCDYLAGYDESGRGALCGPIVAAVVIMPSDYSNDKINDSKKVSAENRIVLEEEIKQHALFWNIVSLDNNQIDQHGIQRANIMVFEMLKDSVPYESVEHVIDGTIMDSYGWCHSIPKGDSISFSIACASILAKTYRDAYIVSIAHLYPGYNLEHNKGYGEDYISKVKSLGFPENIHRHSYKIKRDEIKFF